jgi:hypothetical protein
MKINSAKSRNLKSSEKPNILDIFKKLHSKKMLLYE